MSKKQSSRVQKQLAPPLSPKDASRRKFVTRGAKLAGGLPVLMTLKTQSSVLGDYVKVWSPSAAWSANPSWDLALDCRALGKSPDFYRNNPDDQHWPELCVPGLSNGLTSHIINDMQRATGVCAFLTTRATKLGDVHVTDHNGMQVNPFSSMTSYLHIPILQLLWTQTLGSSTERACVQAGLANMFNALNRGSGNYAGVPDSFPVGEAFMCSLIQDMCVNPSAPLYPEQWSGAETILDFMQALHGKGTGACHSNFY